MLHGPSAQTGDRDALRGAAGLDDDLAPGRPGGVSSTATGGEPSRPGQVEGERPGQALGRRLRPELEAPAQAEPAVLEAPGRVEGEPLGPAEATRR